MALNALARHKGITIHATVFIVHIVLGVAQCTGKYCVVARIGVAIGAIVPLALVVATVNGEELGNV